MHVGIAVSAESVAIIPQHVGHMFVNIMWHMLAIINLSNEVVDHAEYDLQAILKDAQVIWRLCYGRVRRHTRPRNDRGICRPLNKKLTLRNWRSGLRCTLNNAIETWDAGDLLHLHCKAKRRAKAAWTARMDGELQFQDDKRTEAWLHSISEGTMLPGEVSQADQELADARLLHLGALRRKRRRQASKKFAALSPALTLQALINTKLFIEPELAWPFQQGPYTVATARGCIVVHDLVGAEAFLVNDLSKLHLRTAWAVALQGGVVLDAHFLHEGVGSACAYKSALATPRSYWCSERFKREHQDVYDLLARVSAHKHRWKELTMVSFATAVEADAAKPKRLQRPLQRVAIVAMGEVEQLGMHNAFDAHSFITKFSSMFRLASGTCGL